jgi:hypothetical protein
MPRGYVTTRLGQVHCLRAGKGAPRLSPGASGRFARRDERLALRLAALTPRRMGAGQA